MHKVPMATCPKCQTEFPVLFTMPVKQIEATCTNPRCKTRVLIDEIAHGGDGWVVRGVHVLDEPGTE